MTNAESDQTLFWLDIETTGLDPRSDTLLEIAIARAGLHSPFKLTDRRHYVLGCGASRWRNVTPFVVDMHTKSGLVIECALSDRYSGQVEQELLSLVPEFEEHDRKPILAGSSVHFDRDFLRVHMPKLAKRFHHRHYDVSAIKLFCESMGMERIPKGNAHRAVADIEESVAHARLCVQWALERSGAPLTSGLSG